MDWVSDNAFHWNLQFALKMCSNAVSIVSVGRLCMMIEFLVDKKISFSSHFFDPTR